jgi:hypothetical protein
MSQPLGVFSGNFRYLHLAMFYIHESNCAWLDTDIAWFQ